MIAQLNCFRILSVCLLFIFPNLLFSQKKSLHLKQGRLFTTEGIELKFVNLKQQGSVYTIQSRKGKVDVFAQDEILRIEQKKGSEALAWGGYIGALSLVEGMLLARASNPSTYLTPTKKRERDRLIVVSSTVIGTLIGFLIGSTRLKYKKVYDDPAFSFSPKKLGLNFSAPNHISSLTVSYHF